MWAYNRQIFCSPVVFEIFLIVFSMLKFPFKKTSTLKSEFSQLKK